MIDLKPFLDAAPPVALLIALNFVLMAIKKVPFIPNWSIPFIAFAIGGIAYPLLSDPAKVSFAVRCPVCAQVITGLLIGGAAVGSHQMFKQFLNRLGLSSGDTIVITNPPST